MKILILELQVQCQINLPWLYKYDGVSVSVAADVNPGAAASSPNFLTAIGSDIYFSANDGVNGTEPWKYDGTTATMLGDINPGSAGSNPDEFAGAAGFIFFTGLHPTYGFELWKYDGTSAVVQDLYPGTDGSDLGELTSLGAQICFRATNGTQGYELWKHDGVSPTCLDVCTTGPGDFTPWELTVLGSDVFFRGFIQDTGYELWKYDGTTAVLVEDIYTGGGNAHPNHLIGGNTVLYFAATNGVNGNELWKYDGVTTSMVGDINPGSSGSIPFGLTEKFEVIGDDVFLIADNGLSGDEVWRYDGTSLYQGKDIVAGSSSSSPSNLTAYNNALYFMADNMVNGGELWVWKIDQDLTDAISVETCGDYTSPAGDYYTAEGTYDFVDTIPSISCPGCDSIIDVHLFISNPETSMTVYACDTYTSPAGDVYSDLGNFVFTDTISSITCPGVDSIITIDLTVQDNINIAVTAFQGVIFVSQASAEYQWLDCDNGYAPITGETEQDFLPTVDGNYACEITLDLCIDTTACKFVEAASVVGLNEEKGNYISVYPNPVSDKLSITNSKNELMSIRLFNVLGNEIKIDQKEASESFQIDTSQFSKGIYYLRVTTKEGDFVRKIVKE